MKLLYVNFLSVSLLSFLFVACGGPQTASQQTVSVNKKSGKGTVKFRFAPPDGTKAVLTTVTTRVKSYDGRREQKDFVEVRSNLEYKSSSSGYLISEKLTSSNMTRDGLLGQDPISKLLQDMEIKYYVSGDGYIDHIEGYAAVERKAHTTLSENMRDALLPRLTEKVLISEEIREWKDKIADFVGREVAVGEVFHVEVSFALPNGQRVRCLMQTVVLGFEDCPAGRCARIESRYNSWNKPGDTLGNSTQSSLGPQIYGTTSRLIDPNTMLIYSDETQRTMKMIAQNSELGVVPVTLTETRRHTFLYR